RPLPRPRPGHPAGGVLPEEPGGQLPVRQGRQRRTVRSERLRPLRLAVRPRGGCAHSASRLRGRRGYSASAGAGEQRWGTVAPAWRVPYGAPDRTPPTPQRVRRGGPVAAPEGPDRTGRRRVRDRRAGTDRRGQPARGGAAGP